MRVLVCPYVCRFESTSCFPRFSAEGQLQQIAEDGSESREALQVMAERIGDKMQESLLEATSGIQQGLESQSGKDHGAGDQIKLVDETTDGKPKGVRAACGRLPG
jgi:hypothetical protein